MPPTETYLTAIVVLLAFIAALLVGVVVTLGETAMLATSFTVILLFVVFLIVDTERRSA
ncbi:hypothetical protein [Haladaptatus sp. DFWS20]|uniref:hypothetical protein n=1 Tax=Haladaptatus sp. DFWS20 TaxID=3403467 RepID=UPI003EB980E1